MQKTLLNWISLRMLKVFNTLLWIFIKYTLYWTDHILHTCYVLLIPIVSVIYIVCIDLNVIE